MKKYLLSFFILITLAGVTIPIFSAQAQTSVSFLNIQPLSPDGDGTCIKNSGESTTLTYTQCIYSTLHKWLPVGGYAPASHLGFCKLINSVGLNLSVDNKTLTQCTNLSKQTSIVDAVWEPHGKSYGYQVSVLKSPPVKGSCVMLNEAGEEIQTSEVTSIRCVYLSSSASIVSAKWMQNGKRSFTQIKTPSTASGASNISEGSSYKKEGTCTLTYRFGTPKQEVLETNYIDCLFKYEKGVCYADPEFDVDSQGEKIEAYTKRYEDKTADECRQYNWPGLQKTFWELVEYEFTPTPSTNTPTGTESPKSGVCYTKVGDETTLNKTQCIDKASVGNYWISDDANAMANLGTCIRTSTSGQTLTTDGTTAADCTTLSSDSSITSASWKQDGYNVYLTINTPNSINTPSSRPEAADPRGTCTISSAVFVGEPIAPKIYTNVLKSWCDEAIRRLDAEQPNRWTMTFEPNPPVNLICTAPQVLINGTCSTPDGGGTTGDYTLIEALPCKAGVPNCPENGQFTKFNTKEESALCNYLNLMITLFIGLCAVAAVVMITLGGIEYSTSELVSDKGAAKDKIRNALLGLLLALMAWLLLNTINPDILNICSAIPEASTQQAGVVKITNNSSTETQFSATSPSRGSGLVDPAICDSARAWSPLAYFIKKVYAFSPTPVFCNAIDDNGGINLLSDCGASIAASEYLRQEGINFDPAVLLSVYQNETQGGRCVPESNEPGCPKWAKAGTYEAHMKQSDLDALARLIANSAKFREAYGIADGEDEKVALNKIWVSRCPKENGKFKGHGGALGLMQIMPTNWVNLAPDGNPSDPLDAMIAAGKLMEQDRVAYNLARDDVRNMTCKYFSSGICKPGRQSWIEDYGDRAVRYLNQIKPLLAAGRCEEVNNIPLPPPTQNIIEAMGLGLVKPYNPFDEVIDVADGCLAAGSEQKLKWNVEALQVDLQNVIVTVSLPGQAEPVSRPEIQAVSGGNLIFRLGNITAGSRKNFDGIVRIKNSAAGDSQISFTANIQFSVNSVENPRVETDVKTYRICKN